MNAIHKMNQLGSHAHWKGEGVQEVFASPFHLPVNMNGEEGNRCHTSRYSTRPPDCILDSDMLFSLQGNQMFLHSVTDSLPDCQRTSILPLPHLLIFLNPAPALSFSLSLSLNLCV